jgi:cell division protein FtsB
VVHAINNEAYGAALAYALYGNLLFQLEEDEANEEELSTPSQKKIAEMEDLE